MNKSVEMIEKSIDYIARATYPSDDYCLGMIELAYRLGHISDAEHTSYTQAAFTAVTERRAVLRREESQRKMAQAMARAEGRAA